jgi:hypothetical protein
VVVNASKQIKEFLEQWLSLEDRHCQDDEEAVLAQIEKVCLEADGICDELMKDVEQLIELFGAIEVLSEGVRSEIETLVVSVEDAEEKRNKVVDLNRKSCNEKFKRKLAAFKGDLDAQTKSKLKSGREKKRL